MKRTYISPVTITVVCEMGLPIAASVGTHSRYDFQKVAEIPELSIGKMESRYGLGTEAEPIYGDSKDSGFGGGIWDD